MCMWKRFPRNCWHVDAALQFNLIMSSTISKVLRTKILCLVKLTLLVFRFFFLAGKYFAIKFDFSQYTSILGIYKSACKHIYLNMYTYVCTNLNLIIFTTKNASEID